MALEPEASMTDKPPVAMSVSSTANSAPSMSNLAMTVSSSVNEALSHEAKSASGTGNCATVAHWPGGRVSAKTKEGAGGDGGPHARADVGGSRRDRGIARSVPAVWPCRLGESLLRKLRRVERARGEVSIDDPPMRHGINL